MILCTYTTITGRTWTQSNARWSRPGCCRHYPHDIMHTQWRLRKNGGGGGYAATFNVHWNLSCQQRTRSLRGLSSCFIVFRCYLSSFWLHTNLQITFLPGRALCASRVRETAVPAARPISNDVCNRDRATLPTCTDNVRQSDEDGRLRPAIQKQRNMSRQQDEHCVARCTYSYDCARPTEREKRGSSTHALFARQREQSTQRPPLFPRCEQEGDFPASATVLTVSDSQWHPQMQGKLVHVDMLPVDVGRSSRASGKWQTIDHNLSRQAGQTWRCLYQPKMTIMTTQNCHLYSSHTSVASSQDRYQVPSCDDRLRLRSTFAIDQKKLCATGWPTRLTVVPRLAVRLALRNQVARGRSRSSHVVFTLAESLDVCRDFTRSQRRRIVWSGEPPKLRCSTESEMTPCLSAFIFLTAAWR